MATSFVESRKPRSFFGKLVKGVFILFQLLMIAWAVSYCSSLGEMSTSLSSEAERAGLALGGAMGTSLLVGIWGGGSLVLGIFVLLTRGAKVITQVEPKSPE